MYRVVGLLKLNIQLLFVFDGPSRPVKKGKKPPSINTHETKLLREMLSKLGVPCYDAPGEAEAECLRLQQLGLVDAVWTEDGDALMFGCTVLLRFHHEMKGSKKGGEKKA